jgi:hypothetical protein
MKNEVTKKVKVLLIKIGMCKSYKNTPSGIRLLIPDFAHLVVGDEIRI